MRGGFLFWLERLEADESSESKDVDGICRCYVCMGRSVDVDILGRRALSYLLLVAKAQSEERDEGEER